MKILLTGATGYIGKRLIPEKCSAEHFAEYINTTKAEQIIYLGGIVNEEELSKHLVSRKAVEDELRKSKGPLTALRAGIIVGSGSASFKIIRDLIEKLPIMIATLAENQMPAHRHPQRDPVPDRRTA